jgi:small subunit ribosomal protein S1
MEPKSIVHARAVRAIPGGLEMKIGPLHAFMPRSHCGLARGEPLALLVGKTLACEVLEVDRQRQRVLVSRKLVQRREQRDEHQREVGSLRVGQVVHGRVTRIERYGAFLVFGHGLEGLIHVSNLAHERVEHPNAVLRIGETIEAKVLAVREGGKKIALGVKQLRESPWSRAGAGIEPGAIVEGTIKRVLAFGAFVAVLPGVEGLLHVSEVEPREGALARGRLAPGERVSVRVLSLDVERERLALSMRHADGRPIARDEAEGVRDFEALNGRDRPSAPRARLGDWLSSALGEVGRPERA